MNTKSVDSAQHDNKGTPWLRIVILTPSPSLSVRQVAEQYNIVGLSSYTDMPFEDTPSTGLSTFFRRYFNQIRGQQTLQHWAAQRDIPFKFYTRSDPEIFANWLVSRQPDLLITCRAPILPESVFSVPRLGSINIHYSRLPEYRGGSPLLWQIVNGETQGGVTIHFIDPGIDTGPIIEQASVDFPNGASEREILHLLEVLTSQTLRSVLERLTAGDCKGYPQPGKSSTSFAGNIVTPSLVEFIDWANWPVEKIWRTLRYMEYWPQGYGRLQGWRKLLRWKVGRIVSRHRESGMNIWKLETRGLKAMIMCPSGSVELVPEFHLPTLVKGVFHKMSGSSSPFFGRS